MEHAPWKVERCVSYIFLFPNIFQLECGDFPIVLHSLPGTGLGAASSLDSQPVWSNQQALVRHRFGLQFLMGFYPVIFISNCISPSEKVEFHSSSIAIIIFYHKVPYRYQKCAHFNKHMACGLGKKNELLSPHVKIFPDLWWNHTWLASCRHTWGAIPLIRESESSAGTSTLRWGWSQNQGGCWLERVFFVWENLSLVMFQLYRIYMNHCRLYVVHWFFF